MTKLNVFLTSTSIENDKFLFLRNLVFNWQGFINPIKTVRKVLVSNILSPMESFIFSSRHLFDELEILQYFNNLTPESKSHLCKPRSSFRLHCIACYWINRFYFKYSVRDLVSKNNLMIHHYLLITTNIYALILEFNISMKICHPISLLLKV